MTNTASEKDFVYAEVVFDFGADLSYGLVDWRIYTDVQWCIWIESNQWAGPVLLLAW